MMSKLKALIALALGVGSIAYNLIFFCTSFGSSLKFPAMAVGGEIDKAGAKMAINIRMRGYATMLELRYYARTTLG